MLSLKGIYFFRLRHLNPDPETLEKVQTRDRELEIHFKMMTYCIVQYNLLILQVMFHGVVTLVVLVVAAILTAGYVDTCQNLHEEVR